MFMILHDNAPAHKGLTVVQYRSLKREMFYPSLPKSQKIEKPRNNPTTPKCIL